MNTYTSTHKRTIFATLALLLSVCAAQQQAYIIFRNPDVNADANVVTDISQIATPAQIAEIREAVINSVQQSANTAANAVNNVANTATNAANNVADQTTNAANNVVDQASDAVNNIVQNANINANANISAQPNAANVAIAARNLQSGISGLGGLLALPLSLLSLPLSLLGGLTGSR